MGMVRRVVRDVVPMGEIGVALWAWRHRGDIATGVGYGARAVPRLQSSPGDVLTEGKVLARLTADKRTRGADGLRVRVQDGVAVLTGMVPRDVRDAAMAVAANTGGVARVRDDTALVPT